MTSVLRRLSDASATCLICSGLLLSPPRRCPSGAISKPNFVAITTRSRCGAERLAYEFFVREWPISFRCIEECHAAFDGCSDQIDRLLLFDGRTVAIAQPHATKAECRDYQDRCFQVCASSLTLLTSPSRRSRAARPGRARTVCRWQ